MKSRKRLCEDTSQLRVADSSINTEDFGYTYDAAWNLNYRTNTGALSPFEVDQKNELTNAFGAAFSYDANGNLVSEKGSTQNGT